MQDLIEAKQDKLSYDMASREVVAEAMTDILPDSKFAQELAENHKRIFQKLLEKLKEFLADIQAAFKGMAGNRSREANALKQQVGDAVHYLENIVEMFDKVAAEAVENYQKTVAVEEETQEEVKGNERREETREAFLGRAGKALLEVNERGTLAFGFRQCSGKLSAEVQAAEERLKKIGIPVIVIEHMESNKNGVTSIHHGDAMAIPGIAVFIHKDTREPLTFTQKFGICSSSTAGAVSYSQQLRR